MPGSRWVLPAVGGLLALPLLLTAAGRALPREVGVPFLEKAAREGCVEEPAWMRVHHMELLRDLRDTVVRDGRRDGPVLADCASCHRSRERFCDRCHAAVGLDPGCFSCHPWPAEEAP